MARSSADALLTIINDILDFSKIEAGKLELDPTDFNLPNLLEEALRAFVPRAAEKGLELLCEIGPDVPVAYLGDDLTDERAFIALGALGLSVLVRPEWRETAASFWISPPEALREFLMRWLQACREGQDRAAQEQAQEPSGPESR